MSFGAMLLASAVQQTGVDITASPGVPAEVTYSAPIAQWVGCRMRLSNLSSSAATFVVTVYHLASDGTTILRQINMSNLIKTPSNATALTWLVGQTNAAPPFMLYLKSGEKMKVTVIETADVDDNVTVDADWLDMRASSGASGLGTSGLSQLKDPLATYFIQDAIMAMVIRAAGSCSNANSANPVYTWIDGSTVTLSGCDANGNRAIAGWSGDSFLSSYAP